MTNREKGATTSTHIIKKFNIKITHSNYLKAGVFNKDVRNNM